MNFFKRFLPIILIVSIIGCESKFESAKDVITAMHEKWHNKWQKSVQCDQNILFFNADTIVKESHWKQLIIAPDFMQIRYDSFESGNGSLYRNDSVYDFRNGELVNARSFVHYILLLTTSIYFNDEKESLYKLKDFGIDLTKIHETTWNNEEVVIIGSTDITDMTVSQVWIQKENLYVLRTILIVDDKIQDTEFSNYTETNNYFVPTKIVFKSNGIKFIEIHNSNIQFPEHVDISYFHINNFSLKEW